MRLDSRQIKEGLLLFGFYPKARRAIRGYKRAFSPLFCNTVSAIGAELEVDSLGSRKNNLEVDAVIQTINDKQRQ